MSRSKRARKPGAMAAAHPGPSPGRAAMRRWQAVSIASATAGDRPGFTSSGMASTCAAMILRSIRLCSLSSWSMLTVGNWRSEKSEVFLSGIPATGISKTSI